MKLTRLHPFHILATLLLPAGIAFAQLPPPPPPPLGGPLPGLTPAQLKAFNDGRAEFTNVETPATGLGPIFNNNSCVSCHATAAPGGAGPITVTRFGRQVNGVFDPLASLGGSLLQQRAIPGTRPENIPLQANVIAHRQTTPLFGAGLIEAIPDSAMIALAQRPPADGISGRAAMVTDVVTGQQRVGHFGWKAQVASLLAFSADAYVNEMGITNRFFQFENVPNGPTPTGINPNGFEDEPDANGLSDIDRSADFMRFLAAPLPRPLTANGAAGQQIFQQINCTGCHTPVLTTGPSPIVALNQKPVRLYSDLLLHDMGLLGDNIAQGAAQPHEMKTPPLWGLRATAPYLHDGRAPTVDAAIRMHDGEAKNPRDRYLRLTPIQQQQLLEFLDSL